MENSPANRVANKIARAQVGKTKEGNVMVAEGLNAIANAILQIANKIPDPERDPLERKLNNEDWRARGGSHGGTPD